MSASWDLGRIAGTAVVLCTNRLFTRTKMKYQKVPIDMIPRPSVSEDCDHYTISSLLCLEAEDM